MAVAASMLGYDMIRSARRFPITGSDCKAIRVAAGRARQSERMRKLFCRITNRIAAVVHRHP